VHDAGAGALWAQTLPAMPKILQASQTDAKSRVFIVVP
jgi:hypothetical protein